MKNFSMFLVHPEDDKPVKSLDLPKHINKKIYKWQHQVKSTPGTLSMAIIFRVVKDTAVVKIDPSTGKRILTPEEITKAAKTFPHTWIINIITGLETKISQLMIYVP